ncbi:MAG: ATP-binding protein [Muribaculaceae bacterium]|nr:ATP-binding protein [Muribaculaceae bacterium]
MTKEELLARLNDIEWNDFEVKEAPGDLPKSTWETVSAFSNTEGFPLIAKCRKCFET